jgi:hypothetical protein
MTDKGRNPAFNAKTKQCHSVDLSRATDTFQLEITSRLVDGIIDGLRCKRSQNILRAVRPFIDGPRFVMYPPLGDTTLGPSLETDNVVYPEDHKSGIFMGNPTTYSILTVWTRWVDHRARRSLILRSKGKRRYNIKHTLNNKRILVQGDDLVVADCDTRLADERRRQYGLVGNTVGDGSDVVSKYHGEFCEEFSCRDETTSNFKHLDLVKVRPIIGSQTSSTRPGDKGRVDPLVLRGRALRQQLKYKSKRTYNAVLNAHFRTDKRYREMCRTKHSRYLFMPESLGGLEYPHRDGNKHVWRKKIPARLKDIAAAIIQPDKSMKGFIETRLMGSATAVSRHGLEIKEEVLADILLNIERPNRPEGRVRIDFSLDIDQTIGLVTKEEIVQASQSDESHRKYFPDGQDPRSWQGPTAWKERRPWKRNVFD